MIAKVVVVGSGKRRRRVRGGEKRSSLPVVPSSTTW